MDEVSNVPDKGATSRESESDHSYNFFETSCRVAQSQIRCFSQLLRNLLQHLGGVAPPLLEHHLPLCHETAEILEFLECLFWCVGSREAIVNVKRFLDHGCSFRII